MGLRKLYLIFPLYKNADAFMTLQKSSELQVPADTEYFCHTEENYKEGERWFLPYCTMHYYSNLKEPYYWSDH